MKLLAILAISFTTSIAAADVSIMDNNKEISVDCSKDQEVNVIGNHIKVTLNGTCTKVTATGNHAKIFGSTTLAAAVGNHNEFELDGVDVIKVMGNHNKLTYKKPIANKRTKVSNVGKYNKISVAK